VVTGKNKSIPVVEADNKVEVTEDAVATEVIQMEVEVAIGADLRLLLLMEVNNPQALMEVEVSIRTEAEHRETAIKIEEEIEEDLEAVATVEISREVVSIAAQRKLVMRDQVRRFNL
jgi:hypothetical protein